MNDSDLHVAPTRPDWLPEEQWPFALLRREVLGHGVSYVDVGEGPTLLFVHAGMWSFVWREVIDRLSADFRCVAMDFPGSGLSDARPGYRPGLARHSAVLAELVRQLGPDEVTLVLHDLGGPVGLDLARQRPALVRALVLTQTFGWWPRQRLLRGMLRLMGGRTMRALDVATNLVPRLTSSRAGVGRHLDRAGRRAFLGPTRSVGPRAAFHDLMYDAARSRPLLDAVEAALRGSLRARPVLTIFGERNDPMHFQRTWLELFPAARQVVVAKGNHFPMCDDPDLFAASLREWWRDDVAGSASLSRREGTPARPGG